MKWVIQMMRSKISVACTPRIFGESEVVFHWFFKGNLVLLLLTFTTLLSAQTGVNNIMPVGRWGESDSSIDLSWFDD